MTIYERITSYNLQDVSEQEAKKKGKVFYEAWKEFHKRKRLSQASEKSTT